MRRPRGGGRLGASPRLLVVGGAVLWGTTGTAQALAPAGASPATVGAVRLLVGALALLALAAAAGLLGDLAAFTRAGARGPALAAMVAMAAYQVAFFGGVARAGVAVGTVVALGSAPMVTGLLGWLLRAEPPERRWWPATALAVAGLVLLVSAGGAAAGDSSRGGSGPDGAALGVLLALGAGAAYATYTVASKALLEAGRSPAATVAVTFTGAAVLLLPVLLAGDSTWLAEPRGLLAGLWLGVVTVGVAYALFATGLRTLPPASVSTLTLAEPLTAGALGVLLLGERTGPAGAAGALLVVAGLGLLVARRRRPRARGRGRSGTGR